MSILYRILNRPNAGPLYGTQTLLYLYLYKTPLKLPAKSHEVSSAGRISN